MQCNSLLSIWGGFFLICSRFCGFSALQYSLIPAKTPRTHAFMSGLKVLNILLLCVCVLLKLITLCCSEGLGPSFLPVPSRWTWTPARPPPRSWRRLRLRLCPAASSQSYCWLRRKNTQTRIFTQQHALPLTFTGYQHCKHHVMSWSGGFGQQTEWLN